MKFFDRKIKLVVQRQLNTIAPTSGFLDALSQYENTWDVSGLDCEFEAKKTVVPMQPNSLKLKVYNLNKDHRESVESGKNKILLEAGYKDDTVLIFYGQVRSAYSVKEKADWVTYFDTGDSFMEVALAQINTSLAPRTTIAQMMQELAKSLGIKSGNLNSAITKFGGKFDAYLTKRTVMFGNAARHMTDLCDATGLEWSIQDGELQIAEKGKPIDGTGVVLTPETGLIGSPSLELKSAGSFSNEVQIAKSIALSKPGHLIKCRSFINPGLRVGGKVIVKSDGIDAAYRILELKYTGNTRGQEWYADITASHYPQ